MLTCRTFPQPIYFRYRHRFPSYFNGLYVGLVQCNASNNNTHKHNTRRRKTRSRSPEKDKHIHNLSPISQNNDGEASSSFLEEKESKVECKVDLISWRERHISASIVIKADEQTVWDILTDYERLAHFIPNLVYSERIPCPYPGRIWLRQKGLQRALYWHIEAQVVLDLQELPHLKNGKELLFSMVDGDFKRYEGKWNLRLGPRPGTTILSYEVNVIPKFNFPAIFVERIIRKDLPLNLQALAARAEAKSGAILKLFPSQKVSHFHPLKTLQLSSHKNKINRFQGISNPTKSQEVKLLDHEKDNGYEADDVEDNESIATLEKLNRTRMNNTNNSSNNWGTLGHACNLDRPCTVDAVHLRRLDDLLENGGVHRRVIASITVKAPSRKVWKVLTAYESLTEFVPNLAISKIISRENNKVRLLQEGCKGLLYMVLHARIILDLWEHPEHEIFFEQVEGDFDSFQGRWIFEQLGSQHTLLKYDVETKMRKNCLLAEAIVEEVIYKDLPSNLCALRDRVENDETTDLNHLTRSTYAKDPQVQHNKCSSEDSHLKWKDEPLARFHVSDDKHTPRPKVPGLQRDIEILKSELSKFIADHGQEGFMPMRKHLRVHGRIDLEKAITHMGGFRNIASLMNLSLSYKNRKPKGYWDSLENLKQEVSHFQRTWGMDPTYMPSRKSFERAGRYDLARAFEKWGGVHEVSRLLCLKLRHPRKDAEEEEDAFNNSAHIQSPIESINSNKWIRMLDVLNQNWVD